MKVKSKLITLYMASFLVSIAPLVIAVACNFKHYTKTPASIVSIAFGGLIALIFIFLKTINKLPKGQKRVVKYGVCFLVVILLEPIINDLVLLCGMAFVGEILDCVFFERAIKNLKEDMTIDKTATKTAEKIKELIGGRV